MANLPNTAHYNSLVENAGIPIITTDLSGVIITFNRAAEKLYNQTSAEIIGQHISLLFPQYDRADQERAARSVAQDGRTLDMDVEHQNHDGRSMILRLVLSPIRDEIDTIVGIARFALDVTEQVELQTSMQQERDLLEAILETANDAILMLDLTGKVLAVNFQFEAFFQVQRFQIAGRSLEHMAEVISARADLPADFKNILVTYGTAGHQTAAGDFEIDGTVRRVLVWYSAPVHAHDGTLLGRLFVFRDATHEREVDRMKTEFVSLVSHELRTPLTSIKGFADFILDGDAGPVDDEVRNYVEIVKLNAERLTNLISDILDLTRIEAGRMELLRQNVSIDEIFQSVLVSLRPVLDSRNQACHLEIVPDLPLLWADKERMVQILTNLVSNASKYGTQDGRIKICASAVHREDTLPPGAPLTIQLPACLISVHDNGMGIAPQEQPQVFTRFFRTEEATRQQIQGSGLGLTIVKSFVELHGGKIWLNSELGRGTSFYFTVPFVEGA